MEGARRGRQWKNYERCSGMALSFLVPGVPKWLSLKPDMLLVPCDHTFCNTCGSIVMKKSGPRRKIKKAPFEMFQDRNNEHLC